jgi:hypothetical protein
MPTFLQPSSHQSYNVLNREKVALQTPNIVCTAGEPAHPILETFRRLGAINPATARPWQVVGLANYLNPFYDTQVGTSSNCAAPHSLYTDSSCSCDCKPAADLYVVAYSTYYGNTWYVVHPALILCCWITAKPWQVVGLANHLNPRDTQVSTMLLGYEALLQDDQKRL